MAGITEQEAGSGAMYDDPDIFADPDRPEIRVFRSCQFVKLQARMGGVQLEIECGCFDGFLLIARQSG